MSRFKTEHLVLVVSVAVLAPFGSPVLAQCQLDKFWASDGEAGDAFAWSLCAIDDMAILGSPRDDELGESTGSAYVFRRIGKRWLQQTKLLAGDAAQGDLFGRAVCTDGLRLIIGAIADDDRGFASGSAYIFRLENGVWVQEAKLVANDGAVQDFFGSAVAISGDFAAVGAPGADVAGVTDSGAVYVFRRNGTLWVQQARLTDRTRGSNEMGLGLALQADLLVLGAPTGVPGTQKLFVFHYDGSTWAEEAMIPTPSGAGFFGESISIDGIRFATGNTNENLRGAAYVYRREGTSWVQEARVVASDGEDFDNFGRAVSLMGDYLLVGNDTDNDLGLESGSAYVFREGPTGWRETAKLLAEKGQAGDAFGFSLSLTSGPAVIGAFSTDTLGRNSGSAYSFWVRLEPDCNGNKVPDPCEGVPGDFDGDGDADLADFLAFQLCFAGPRVPPAPTCPQGVDADLDCDGDVDLADFIMFQQNFTGSS